MTNVSLFAAALWFAVGAAGRSAGAVAADVASSDRPSLSTSSLLSSYYLKLIGRSVSQKTTDVDQLSMASSVRVKKNFLSKFESFLYRHNENKYEHITAVGFSGDRTWGGAYLPRSFMRRLIEEGAEQCASDDYQDTLPSGMSIVTNYVKETTDAHLDVNPTTSKHINNDVGVVFLNTHEDATFVVGDKAVPIEEGTLIMFPGGSVPHHIEMKKEGGFVHMLGPFEVGGSHGTVGQVVGASRQLITALVAVGSDGATGGVASFIVKRRRQLEGEGGTNPDTNSKEGATGEMYVFGYHNGIDPSGMKNQTLEIQFHGFNLDEIDTACSTGSCTVELNDNAKTCDDSNDSEENRVILVEDLVKAVSEIGYIDVGRNVEELFDRPISIHGNNGTVLACAIFAEIEDISTAAEILTESEDISAVSDSPSGAMGSTAGLAAFVILFSSFFTSIAFSL